MVGGGDGDNGDGAASMDAKVTNNEELIPLMSQEIPKIRRKRKTIMWQKLQQHQELAMSRTLWPETLPKRNAGVACGN